MTEIEEILKEYADNLYVAKMIDSYGADGENKLNELTQKLREIYAVLDLRRLQIVYVVNSLDSNEFLKDYTEYSLKELVSWDKDTIIIEITNGKLRVNEANSFEPIKVCAKAIVYEFRDYIESFYLSNGAKDILSKLEGRDSYYLRPSYKELDEALSQYKFREARTSSCLILRQRAWTNENRVILNARPEWILRDSLFQFLKSNLRNFREVLREQNVDEKKPIDIKISWNYSNRVALIEVKWIGMSGSGHGYIGSQAKNRVNEGANQLVEYLNLFNTESPDQNTRGYLVTFDARREGVNKKSTEVTRENGFFFKEDEIVLSPDYPNERNDFEPHVRVFLEPKCQN
ncbi:MAG: hypothetical protein Mars2KO_44170 [Maribacter sp.]